MGLQELQPDLERIYDTIITRRDQVPQDLKSTTVRLLNTGWVSTTNQTVDTTGKLVKPFSIGDKLVEEACEVAKAKDRDNIKLESSQAIYYIEVGLVKEGFTNSDLFRSIDWGIREQATAVVVPDKIAEYAGAAVARVALAGVSGNRELLLQRSMEALIGLNRFWETNDISPAEVGKAI